MSKHRASARRAASRIGLAAVLIGIFAFVASQANAQVGSPSGFESGDGNMKLDATTTNTNTDWNCFVGTTGGAGTSPFQPGTANSKCKVTSGADHITGTSNGDLQWVSGQKFQDPCPSTNQGNNPPKDQFTDVASYSETNTDPTSANYLDTYFYGANIRDSANGNSSGDVEFNQAPAPPTSTTDPCHTASWVRTAGDKLIAYDFLNGGGSPVTLHVLTWVDSAHNNLDGGTAGQCYGESKPTLPCWGETVFTPNGNLFDGHTNGSAITAADNGIDGLDLVVNRFSEFGVNLTDALGLTGCTSFPQQVWESRSSGSSFGSNPEDIIIQSRTIQNCGEIKIIKHTDPRGQNQAFSYTSSPALPHTNDTAHPANGGGVICSGNTTAGVQSDGSFCLNDNGNSGTANSAANTVDMTNVPQGTYTVTEGAEPGAFAYGGVSCTATTGSSGSAVANTQSASITLVPGGVVTCTFTNMLHQGAIVITKTGKDVNCASATSTTANGTCTSTSHVAKLGGAKFKLYNNSDLAAAHQVGTEQTTGNDGTACFDGLSWTTGGTTYYVKETGAPAGYALPSTVSQSVSVSQNATCSSTTNAATVSFADDPLTNITVHAAAQKAGATHSNITCVKSGTSTNIGDSPKPKAYSASDPTTLADDITMHADNSGSTNTGVPPGTYVCTIVVDP